MSKRDWVEDGVDELRENWSVKGFDEGILEWAVRMKEKWGLNWSETQALAHLIQGGEVGRGEVYRRQSPDFKVVPDIGVEVKRKENYSISRKQLRAVERYGRFIVVVSNQEECYVKDIINDVVFEYDD